MSEINNNMFNYGYNKIDRLDNKSKMPKQQAETPKETDEQQYVKDTGVLGRSLVHNLNGGNIAKSVDEAVEIAENEPIRMNSSETLFDTMYRQYLDEGMDESDAYMQALLDEEEFLDISASLKR